MSAGEGVSCAVTPPSPAVTSWAQDWERARYKRFTQLQWQHEFDEAIQLLNEEYPPLEFDWGCMDCGRGFVNRLRAEEHICIAKKEALMGRPPLELCKRGHDLSVTRRSWGCARCHEDRKRERATA